jgi:protease-4
LIKVNRSKKMLVLRNAPILHKIAVVELFGTIGSAIKSSAYEPIFSSIEKDNRIRAMVLDIDSPGGSVPTSDYIYRTVAKIAEKKPAVASIRGVGASGSYYISCAANKIIATPAAIVGSIGVISVRPALQELLQRVGVSVNVSKSGQFKDMGAPWRQATPEEQAKMQELIDDSFSTFVSIVAKARNLSEERVREIATGEIYWATKAKELGLIDELGDLDSAIDMAAEMAHAPRRPMIMRPRRSLRQLLLNPAASAFAESISEEVERRLWSGTLRF